MAIVSNDIVHDIAICGSGVGAFIVVLKIEPCVPVEGESFIIHYHYMKTVYHIQVRQKESLGMR